VTVGGNRFDRRILLKWAAQIDQLAINPCGDDIAAELAIERVSRTGAAGNLSGAAVECDRYFSVHLNASAEQTYS
jgi:hypothetical protein